jgi:hypothetical protein
VLILADEMGFSDVGCYGSEVETPNLNSLAQFRIKPERRHDERTGSRITKQRDMGHRLALMRSPVTQEVPADRAKGENAKSRVKDRCSLSDRVKRAEGHGKTRNKFKKDGADSTGKKRGPS